MDFADEAQKELYEVAVANIEKQEIVDYMFFYKDQICIKLSKEQYLRFLKYYIWYYNLNKPREYWLPILKGEIGSSELAEPSHYLLNINELHSMFPQIFPDLKLTHIGQINFLNYFSAVNLMKVFKNYAVVLFVKYHNYLTIGSALQDLIPLDSSKEDLEEYAEAFFDVFDWGKLKICLTKLNNRK